MVANCQLSLKRNSFDYCYRANQTMNVHINRMNEKDVSRMSRLPCHLK